MENGVTLQDSTIVQQFGVNALGYARFGLAGHDGVDLATFEGQQLYAPEGGRIKGPFLDPNGWGLNLAVETPAGARWYLCHLSSTQESKEGDWVEPGTPIALAGHTGNTLGGHVHVTYQPNADYAAGPYRGRVDPVPFLLRLLR